MDRHAQSPPHAQPPQARGQNGRSDVSQPCSTDVEGWEPHRRARAVASTRPVGRQQVGGQPRSASADPNRLLLSMEAVAQTSPQTGLLISRGTTLARSAVAIVSVGRRQRDSSKFAVFIPQLLAQPDFTHLRDSLHAKQQSAERLRPPFLPPEREQRVPRTALPTARPCAECRFCRCDGRIPARRPLTPALRGTGVRRGRPRGSGVGAGGSVAAVPSVLIEVSTPSSASS
jgi:hypothetical protein